VLREDERTVDSSATTCVHLRESKSTAGSYNYGVILIDVKRSARKFELKFNLFETGHGKEQAILNEIPRFHVDLSNRIN